MPHPSFLRRLVLANCLLAAVPLGAALGNGADGVDVMPLPATRQTRDGRLAVTARFSIAVTGKDEPRLDQMIATFRRRWERRTGLTFSRNADGTYAAPAGAAGATLVIDCAATSPQIPRLGDDESYTLQVGSKQALLRAPTTLGARDGLETLLQLLQSDAAGWFIPGLAIEDRPRFPWRGLLIDVGRHWEPVEVIKRSLDGMALVKLNVLHLHLTEDQGFRIESKTHPELQQQGSDGHFFTQAQMRDIIAYAAARGIRVVPEFDMPGHTASWFVSHPELASAPGPYAIVRRWGVFDPVMDPTNEKLYALLDDFLGEMAALFPDPFVHIGGDENNGVQWSANPQIQAFIQQHHLRDNAGLQTWFSRRVQAILAKHGKRVIGWDEILQPGLPTDAVIQSWRGPASLAVAAKQGYAGILSSGYYIDLMHPASSHYIVDPLPAGLGLTPAQAKLVLGGEATMWGEWVGPETIDSRIWPRTAAIAERLWSPRDVTDIADMYRRLALVNERLSEAGTRQIANHEPMLRRYAGDRATPADRQALREFVALVEPVKAYRRGGEQPDATQFMPLTGLADCAAADSAPSRAFARAIDQVAFAGADPATLDSFVADWRSLDVRVQSSAPDFGPRGPELSALAHQLGDLAALTAEAASRFAAPLADDSAWAKAVLARIEQDAQPHAAVELPVAGSLRLLVVAIAERDQRAALPPAAWRKHVEELAFPHGSAE
ncbi:MAG TPA: family 20 glycosylhydrolase [Opitutus sp.]|nr:family 20 glycosylhydrolase [Opitutus sp.]